MSSAGAPASTIDDAIDRIGFGRFQNPDTLGEPIETGKPRFSRVASQRERQPVG